MGWFSRGLLFGFHGDRETSFALRAEEELGQACGFHSGGYGNLYRVYFEVLEPVGHLFQPNGKLFHGLAYRTSHRRTGGVGRLTRENKHHVLFRRQIG